MTATKKNVRPSEPAQLGVENPFAGLRNSLQGAALAGDAVAER